MFGGMRKTFFVLLILSAGIIYSCSLNSRCTLPHGQKKGGHAYKKSWIYGDCKDCNLTKDITHPKGFKIVICPIKVDNEGDGVYQYFTLAGHEPLFNLTLKEDGKFTTFGNSGHNVDSICTLLIAKGFSAKSVNSMAKKLKKVQKRIEKDVPNWSATF